MAPTKEGYLNKQGGGEGGHKNWKKRYFVLDTPNGKLDYFSSSSDYEKGKPPLGTLKLDIYKAKAEFVEEGKKPSFEFAILAYPKSMTVRASPSFCDRSHPSYGAHVAHFRRCPAIPQLRGANLEEMQEWLNILQTPIDETIASSTLYEDALNDLKLADDAPIKGIKRRGLC